MVLQGIEIDETNLKKAHKTLQFRAGRSGMIRRRQQRKSAML
jgi:hypothetical protein